jgi:putative flippase GtrA
MTDRRPERLWRILLRHQAGSIAASLLDFGAMIACVEIAGLDATAATAIGASSGAMLNFTLGRTWIFRRHEGDWRTQVLRYALVSGASAGWNTLGEHFVSGTLHIEYVLARLLVALTVSLAWNFPLQRRFVFREGAAA